MTFAQIYCVEVLIFAQTTAGEPLPFRRVPNKVSTAANKI